MTNWSIAHPAILLIAPVAVLALAAAARRTATTLAPWRRVLSGLVRGSAVVLLTFAMVGPSATLRQEQPYLTVFLADVSESVSREAWEKALPELRQAWNREFAAGNRCALVAFAGSTEVLVPPGRNPCPDDLSRLSYRGQWRGAGPTGEAGSAELAALKSWTERLQTSSTDFARGLSAARALFQEDAVNRIVLLTDGRSPLRPAREIDLPPGTSVVRLEGSTRQEIAVTDVSAPLVAREGEPFDVRVTLHAAAPGTASIRLWVDDEPGIEVEQTVTLPAAGRHTVLLKSVQQRRSLRPKLQLLRVVAHAPGTDPRNNLGVAAVMVTGKPRVLLVEGTSAEAEPLARLLQAQDIEFVREPAVRLSERRNLEEFVAVILAGVPREFLGPEVVQTLSGYVSESGGGLWVVGSAALKGEHGYAKSEFEKLLPVTFADAPPTGAGTDSEAGKKEDQPPRPPPPGNEGTPKSVLTPTLAILFIVDKSGSMAGDPIALVKQACIGSAQLLTAKDYVGVLAFDVKPRWVLPFTEADQHAFIEGSVKRLFADGGTHIYPAMVEALRAFRSDSRARNCAVKHAVLLSDGVTFPADFKAVTQKMAEEGITVSTVCLGFDDFNAELMGQIAGWGGGRFIFAATFKKVPQLFLTETKTVLDKVPREAKPPPAIPPPQPKPAAAEGPKPNPAGNESARIPVVVRDPHEILRGVAVASLPELRGKLGAAARSGKVEVPLATADGQPVLALARSGLGRVAVWTSDLSGAWSADWLPWKDTGKLFAQLVRHLYSATPDAELATRVTVTTRGSEAFVRVEAGPAGETLALKEQGEKASREFPLRRAAEGGWSATVPLERAGVLQRLVLERGDGKQLTLGAMRAYESEFAPADAEHDLFAVAPPLTWQTLEKPLSAAKMSSERRRDFTPWAVLAALLLLPLDVALRRFSA